MYVDRHQSSGFDTHDGFVPLIGFGLYAFYCQIGLRMPQSIDHVTKNLDRIFDVRCLKAA